MNNFFEELDQEIYQYGGSWTAFLVRALWQHSDGLSRQDTLAAVRQDAVKRGHEIPPTFNDVIQATFQQHNSGSSVFCGNADKNLFRFVGRKGDGLWALNRERALTWMSANGRAPDFTIASDVRE